MWISYLEAEILKKRISRFRGRFCIFRGTQDQNLPQDLIIKVTVSRCISKWWSECWSNFYCLKPLIGANANSSNRVLCKKVGCAESEICSLEHLFSSIVKKTVHYIITNAFVHHFYIYCGHPYEKNKFLCCLKRR